MKLGKVNFNITKILCSTLCKEEDDRQIVLEVFQSSKSGKHKNMGSSVFELKSLKNQQNSFELKKKNSSVGTLALKELKIKKRNSFLNYVFGGCEISLIIAADFTLSNGPPTEADSLHCMNPAKNEYL